MESEKKYVIKKDAKTDVITYMEYEKLKGLSVKPKNNVSFEDMINVNEMILINPSLIEKLISKKCTKTFDRILKMISVVSDDEDDDTGYSLILDEIARFKNLLMSKYKDYMEEKEYELSLKKLKLLKEEVEHRKNALIETLEMEMTRKGKSSR
ncbi:MAG: hypothetical protein IJL74_02200 [Bacilli bacterium]|nr:hypothetical protein [Bacilli bacterium]